MGSIGKTTSKEAPVPVKGRQPQKEVMQRIGILGRPEYVNCDVKSDLHAYKESVVDKFAKKNEQQLSRLIRKQQGERANMLQWLRGQEGRANFLIPLQEGTKSSEDLLLGQLRARASKASNKPAGPTESALRSARTSLPMPTVSQHLAWDSADTYQTEDLAATAEHVETAPGQYSRETNFYQLQEPQVSQKPLVPVSTDLQLVYPCRRPKLLQRDVISKQQSAATREAAMRLKSQQSKQRGRVFLPPQRVARHSVAAAEVEGYGVQTSKHSPSLALNPEYFELKRASLPRPHENSARPTLLTDQDHAAQALLPPAEPPAYGALGHPAPAISDTINT